jgi:DNA-directed RNA polymerase specialized sigma24 family protein
VGRPVKSKFAEVISLAIQKYGNKIPWQDKNDLRQEAELVLYEAGLKYDILPDRLAYKIVKNQVIDYLKRMPPKMEDITNPDVIRKYDKQVSYNPNIDVKLDAEKAVHFVNQLPNPYRFILIMTFGLEDNPQFTEKELSESMQKSAQWVERTKKLALDKLKIMMGRK